MAAETYVKIHRYGTQAEYEALATKNPNLLYFTDAGKLYKGDLDITNQFISVATVPATGVAGKIYLETSTDQVKAYIGNAWKVISYPIDTDFVGEAGDNAHVPTTKAVVDYVEDAISDMAGSANVIKSISQKTNKGAPVVGTFTYTKGDDTDVDVQLSGVSGTPTWNAETRVLTIPVVGGNAVEVNIGKDMFIDPTADNGYNPTTNTIDIYLNDGTETTDPTKVSIPVDSLVEDYVGEDTASIDLSIDENHKVTASLKLSATTNSALSIAADGLKLDLSAYATTATVDQRFTNVENRVTTLEGTMNSTTAAVATINGDRNTEGSIDYKIYNATTATSQKLADLDTRVGAAETNITDLQGSVTNLAAAALQWGTFSE